MRKMNQTEIKAAAKKIVNNWLAVYSLPNAKKISKEIRKLILAEQNRRKAG